MRSPVFASLLANAMGVIKGLLIIAMYFGAPEVWGAIQYSSDYDYFIKPVPSQLNQIPGFTLLLPPLIPIEREANQKTGTREFFTISGVQADSKWELGFIYDGLTGAVPLKKNNYGQFRIRVPINTPDIKLKFLGVKVDGTNLTSDITFQVVRRKKKGITLQFSLGTSLGLTYLQYRQTNVPDFNFYAITTKLDTQLRVNESWLIGANVFFNALPFGENIQNTTVRFLGVNLRGGYQFNLGKGWRLSALIGAYMNIMFVSTGQFGYTPILYPQVYPIVSKTFSNRHSVYLYGKYVSLSPSWNLSLDQRELAAGCGWNFPVARKSLTLSLDFSDMLFSLGSFSTATLRTLTLGVGMPLL